MKYKIITVLGFIIAILIIFYSLKGRVVDSEQGITSSLQETRDSSNYILPKYYIYNKDGKIHLLSSPNGEPILNKEATDFYGYNYFYKVSNLDRLVVIIDSLEWAKVQHKTFPDNTGWIRKEYLIEVSDKASTPSNDRNSASSKSVHKSYDKDFERWKKAEAIRERRKRENIAIKNQRELNKAREQYR